MGNGREIRDMTKRGEPIRRAALTGRKGNRTRSETGTFGKWQDKGKNKVART